jgi:hypothetical protein
MFRFAQHDSAIFKMSSSCQCREQATEKQDAKKIAPEFSTARFRLKTIGANQASVFFVALADL